MNSFVYAMCAGAFAMSFAGCLPNESVSGGDDAGGSSSTGNADPMLGKSPAIEAFQSARRVALNDPASIAVIDAQSDRTKMVNVSPEAESLRVSYVLDWTVDEYEQVLAQIVGITFDRGLGPRTQAEAELASARFETAAADRYESLPEQSWDTEWASYESDVMVAHAEIESPPGWKNVIYRSRRGALMCMKIIAVQSGADSMPKALGSLVSIRSLLFKGESAALRVLENIHGQ